MLAEMTSKSQLTLPKSVVSQFQGSLYVDVRAEYGRIILGGIPANPAGGWTWHSQH